MMIIRDIHIHTLFYGPYEFIPCSIILPSSRSVMLSVIQWLSCWFTYHLQHIAIPYMKVVLSVAGCCGWPCLYVCLCCRLS